jgi:polysaccharide export outer membrane protein
LKRKHEFVVTVSKDGYQSQEARVHGVVKPGGVAGGLGNGIIGGLIGAAIDVGNGSMMSLSPNRLKVTLPVAGSRAESSASGEPQSASDEPGWVTRRYGKWVTVQDQPGTPITPAGNESSSEKGSSAPKTTPAPQVTIATNEYRIAKGDKLKIATFGEDRFSGEFLVHGDGKITFPLFGDIRAAGLTSAQLVAAITSKLTPDYLRDPRVTAEVISFRPVYILGEVARPGEYPFTEGMTMYALIAQAGGFSYRANRNRAFVRHDNETAEQRLDLQSSTPVRPGDTIRIPQRIF